MINLYKYQQDYFNYIVKNNKRNWIYAWDVGTGKTIIALKHYETFYNDTKLIIVAPASKINEQGWDRTILKYYPHINYETCTYNVLNKKYKEYKGCFIIFDEIHRLKNSTGVWGKAGYELTKIAKGFIGLTATPSENWLDTCNYFKMFGLVKNKTQFLRNEAITTSQRGYMEIIGWRNENKLKNMWKLIAKELPREQAIELPPIVYEDIIFKASSDYKKIKKSRIYKEEVLDTNIKLRHALRVNVSLVDKINYIKNMIEDTDANIVVFYNYDTELEELKKVIDKKLYVCNGHEKNYPKKEDWDKIKNSVTLANYKSGAEAVEFTYANVIIYFSPSESYTDYYQSLGRCYRNGQDKKVTVYKFITEDTVENNIYLSLENKQDFNFDLWAKEELNK